MSESVGFELGRDSLNDFRKFPKGDVESVSKKRAHSLTDLVLASGIRKIHLVAWRDLDDPRAGGSELHAHEIAKRWASAGLDVSLRTGGVVGAPSVIERGGYKVVRKSGRYLTFPRTALSGMVGRSGKWDALVEIWNGMPFLTPLWSRGPRVAILHHIHAEALWRSVLPGVLAPAGAYMERHIAPKFYRGTRVITPSQSSAEEVIRILGWPEDYVNVVYPGVDPRFRPGGEKSQVPLVVAVGRLVPVKRFDWLIKSVHEIRQRIGPVQLVIAGDGEYRSFLETCIAKYKAKDWCKLPGRISDEEVVDLYRRAWVVASASEREGWGMTLSEAAACGTPAVATRIAGHEDAVVHGVTGLLATSQEELTLALETVLKDPKLRGELAIGALRHGASLTWDAAAASAFQVVMKAVGDFKKNGKSLLSYSFEHIDINKRGAERFKLDVPVRIGEDLGRVKDMSLTGALILPPSGYEVSPGDTFSGWVEMSSRSLPIEGRVVRQIETEDGLSAIGVWLTSVEDETVEMLAAAKLQRMGEVRHLPG